MKKMLFIYMHKFIVSGTTILEQDLFYSSYTRLFSLK